jgi:hypothetical protein
MNANELANLLEVDSWYKLVTREEIATMLRQQQAEIEALKKQLYFKEYYEELPDTPVGLLENFKPVWQEKLAVRELTNEEIGDFTHRMVLCCQVHPSSADINVLGLAQIVEEIRKL